jgi:hypothetical protein
MHSYASCPPCTYYENCAPHYTCFSPCTYYENCAPYYTYFASCIAMQVVLHVPTMKIVLNRYYSLKIVLDRYQSLIRMIKGGPPVLAIEPRVELLNRDNDLVLRTRSKFVLALEGFKGKF